MKVSGSGSGKPTGLVSFPGEYTADTPGVVFDVYQGDAEYPVSLTTLFIHNLGKNSNADDSIDPRPPCLDGLDDHPRAVKLEPQGLVVLRPENTSRPFRFPRLAFSRCIGQ